MTEVIAKIKKQYLEFGKKQWPPYHGKTCNVAVEIVVVKNKIGQSNEYSPTHCQLKYSDLFKVSDGRVVRKVLLEGYGGSGKTLLCTSLCLDWANGVILQQYKLVLLIPLHHSKVVSAGSLPKLFKLLFPDKQQRIAIRKIFKEKEDEVLILADGWNHLANDERQDGTFIYRLLFGNELLPQASVLVTSRPSSSIPLHNVQCIDQVVEIHGFRKDSIKQYINLVLATDKASRLLTQLQHNQAAEVLCSVPLNCAIISHLWYTFGIEIIPETMTDLYTIFVSNVIVSTVKKEGYSSIQLGFAGFPDDIQEHFWHCCRFAFQAIEKKEITFSQHDVAMHFGLLQPLELPFEASREAFFQFVHPVVMEYLAALHLTQ